MTFQRHFVVSAAAVILASVTGGAVGQTAPPPGYPSNYYNSNPTPEEQAATKALNARQAETGGVTAAGETGADVDAHNRDVQTRYQQEMRAYEQRRELYRRQTEDYERRYGTPDERGGSGP